MTNLFTVEQILEIRERLAQLGAKDTEFPKAALPLNGKEEIALVQEGENKRVALEEFYEEFATYIDKSERVDFFNVSRYVQRMNNYDEVARLTLAEAVEACPEDVQRAGQTITFMDNSDEWEVWQYAGSTPEDWSDTATKWKAILRSDDGGFTFDCDINSVSFGQTATAQLSFETVDGGPASKVDVYVNNVLLRTYSNVSTFHLSYEVTGATIFKVVAVQYGYTHTETKEVELTYTAYVGSGSAINEIMIPANARQVAANVKSAFNVTFSATNYLYIIAPSSVVIGPITMSGFEVPMKEPLIRTINEVEYAIYQSSNTYVTGTHSFVVGNYAGSDVEMLQSMQTDIAGLQTLFGEQKNDNIEQQQAIDTLQERTQALEQHGLDTADNEDIVVSDQKYKFSNKGYNVDSFSGLGRIWLRKNLTVVTTQPDPNTTVSQTINLLTQSMISNTNTIFILQYDYDLNGGEITLPEGCILKFEGGSINNGTLNLNGAVILDSYNRFRKTDLTVTGMPAAGTFYFQNGRPTWSNGTNWVDANGDALV